MLRVQSTFSLFQENYGVLVLIGLVHYMAFQLRLSRNFSGLILKAQRLPADNHNLDS
jgi:hypothetical protein